MMKIKMKTKKRVKFKKITEGANFANEVVRSVLNYG
jgi:hypothetical protein